MHKLLLHDGWSLHVGILSRARGSTTISTSSVTLGQVFDILEGNTENVIDNLYLEGLSVSQLIELEKNHSSLNETHMRRNAKGKVFNEIDAVLSFSCINEFVQIVLNNTSDPRLASLHILGCEEHRDHLPVSKVSLGITTTSLD